MENTTGHVWAIWYEKTPDTPQVAFRSTIYYPIPEANGICKKMCKSFDTPRQAREWIANHPKQNFYRPHIKDSRDEKPLADKLLTPNKEEQHHRRTRPFRTYR